MIDEVTMEKTTFAEVPQRFEAGTPPIVQVIGLGEAKNYISKIGLEEIQIYEKHLYKYAYEKIINIPNLKIIGHSDNKGGIMSFTISSIHPSDIGTILDQDGIAIRTGHHCNQPLMKKLGISATARLSFGVYNTLQDIDILIDSLKKINKFFEK